MRVTRCPIDLALHSGQTVTLPEETANHLVRVMRLREGDAVLLFNGRDGEWITRAAALRKRDLVLECVEPGKPLETPQISSAHPSTSSAVAWPAN